MKFTTQLLVVLMSPLRSAHFCVHPYNICGEASALLYGEKFLKAELCFHHSVHFASVPINIYIYTDTHTTSFSKGSEGW